MHIALATCTNLPGWEADDLPFHKALEERGIPFTLAAWEDPNVRWQDFDACLIRTTWNYMERCDAFIAWIRHVDQCTRLYNTADVIQWNANKSYLRTLAAGGIPIAPTVWLSAGQGVDIGEIMHTRGWSRGFIKPMVGACAHETLRFDATETGLRAAQDHLNRTLQTDDMMVQPYLPRVEVDGEVSFLYFDGVLSHVVQKVPVPGDYRVQDDFGASDHPYTPTDDQRSLADRVLAQAEAVRPDAGADPLLYARVDFLFGEEGELLLTELELIEPSLFFRHGPDAPGMLADALARRLR
jgi:hypothetical protein